MLLFSVKETRSGLPLVHVQESNEHLLFENIKPTSTITIFQDEHQQTPTLINKKTSDLITTKIDTIYTTIIISSTILPEIYNVSKTGNAHQQQNNPSSSINDPNKKASVEDDLEKDKQALKRMSTILSLVGGLGVIAIVATIVIFTRMRSRHRKQREIEEGNSTYELSHDMDRPNTIRSTTSNGDNPTDSSTTTSSNDIDRPLIEPSAPPALLMIDESNTNTILPESHHRRNVISMSSQRSAPSPSAPTAKELDAMVDDQASSSNTTNHQHGHATSSNPTSCSRCAPTILIAPELPPPAYTPSAPPHYALPEEPMIIEPRRHSSGG